MTAYLISDRGEMWPRNTANIEAVLGSKKGGQGIYILFDGSTPVYVERHGKAHIVGTISVGMSCRTSRTSRNSKHCCSECFLPICEC